MASRRGFRRSSLHHVGFFQPRQPAFWLYVVIVVATGAGGARRAELLSEHLRLGMGAVLAVAGPVRPAGVPGRLLPGPLRARAAVAGRRGPGVGCGGGHHAVGDRQPRMGAHGGQGGRTRVRGALDRGAHRAVRRGDAEGLRRGADLPDRARRDRRRDGRVRLRGRVRPGVRDRRGRLLLHERVRRPAGRRAAGVLPAGGGERVCTRTCSTPDWWAWPSGWWSRAAPPNRWAAVCGSRPACVPWRCSATSCGTPRCSTSSLRNRGPAPIG